LKFDLKNFLKSLKLNESGISAILGAIVVLVVGIFVVNYFKGKGKEGTITPGAVSTIGQKINLPTTHTVNKGDSLWKIAEQYYGSGYNWVNIAKENQITNPGLISEGQTLKISQIEAKIATTITREKGREISNTISGATYEVIKGDNLWNIAVRAYGDGYKWNEIARENNLSNPNLIHPGNILTLSR
jgi:putative chitinase